MISNKKELNSLVSFKYLNSQNINIGFSFSDKSIKLHEKILNNTHISYTSDESLRRANFSNNLLKLKSDYVPYMLNFK